MSTYTPVPCPGHPGWYRIPGYPGCCAHPDGRILTLKTGHITRGGNAGRYLKISAYKDGATTPSLVHVHDLICRAFYGPPQPGQVVLHDNDVRWDNRKSNLSWGTQSQNIQSVWDNGLRQRVRIQVASEDYPLIVVKPPAWAKW